MSSSETMADSVSPAARCTAMASRRVPIWALIGSEEEVAHRLVPAVAAGLVVEPPELFAGEQRQAHVDGGRELCAEAAGGAAGAAGTGCGGVVEEDDGAAPKLGKVPGHRGAHDAGANDHHVGRAGHIKGRES